MTEPENILQHFTYEHLPPHLAAVSKIFADAAAQVLVLVPSRDPERTVALRKLIEGKDAAVRAAVVHARAQGGAS